MSIGQKIFDIFKSPFKSTQETQASEVEAKNYDLPLQTPTQGMKKNPTFTPMHNNFTRDFISPENSNRPSQVVEEKPVN